ncbi:MULTISPECIES: YtxH domain-containing protein [unclassified Streptomyces]|uniref:YtxH domain-containing protein n=1 Tax=unclassified Streptomyces TaxID=2593676 RepID=UPI0022B6DFAE|nr:MULTISPECIES: YtxH domain-containing protein [unclassified Streptomyces]MCZ7414118.1 YtxH domain-containing protein [Streptomyces sp. WMMC897]MCZ7431137.1 YtxH domain-containing protein [Streptomyces sp. WMMC1477]
MRYRLTFLTGLAIGYVAGARAGRERYEQLRNAAQRFAENPAVRNTFEAAAVSGRDAAGRAADRMGDRLPHSVSERMRAMSGGRGPGGANGEADDWGTSNT